MVNHNSKKANVYYRIAHILWFLSIAVLPIVIYRIILLAIPVLLTSLFLRVMGTVAYLSGNDKNTNRSDLKRRALKMQNMSRFYWVLAPLCLLICIAIFLNSSGNPYGAVVLWFICGILGVMALISAISTTIIKRNIIKRHHFPKHLKSTPVKRKPPKKYYDDKI